MLCDGNTDVHCMYMYVCSSLVHVYVCSPLTVYMLMCVHVLSLGQKNCLGRFVISPTNIQRPQENRGKPFTFSGAVDYS